MRDHLRTHVQELLDSQRHERRRVSLFWEVLLLAPLLLALNMENRYKEWLLVALAAAVQILVSVNFVLLQQEREGEARGC